MPSELDQLASSLGRQLADGLNQAASQAAAAPERLHQIVDQAVEQAGNDAQKLKEIPAEQLRRLKDGDVDWLGLITFLAVRLQELAGDPPLRVGAYDAGPGWSRALALGTVQPLPGGEATLLLALALGPATNGIIVAVDAPARFLIPAGPIMLSVVASGAGEWRFPFKQPVKLPGGDARLAVDLRLTRDLINEGSGAVHLLFRSPYVKGLLTAATESALTWQVELGVGDAGDGGGGPAGLKATVDLADFLGVLAGIIHVQAVDERYSPQLTLSSAEPPRFDIGHGRGA